VSSLVAALILLASPLFAQSPVEAHMGLPQDWSTRHLIFTNGASPEVAAAAERDPRYFINWMLHSAAPLLTGDHPIYPPQQGAHTDWAMSLGPTGGMPVGETPAKYSFNINGTPNCANDFVVFTIAAAPSATQANIVAFNNLYTGTASSSCPFGPQTPPTTDYTQPTFMWSYAVGTNQAYLSPVLSLDGTKVAFVEGTSPAAFFVLTPTAGQGTSATAPATPAAGAVAQVNYTSTTVTGCTANTAGDSNSSAYIDYINDVAYVGADNGVLYRIGGVFHGTPTLQYCITVNAGKQLTSPVYDSVHNEVFVSDGFSVYGYTPGTTGFTLVKSIAVASNAGTDPIVLSPIVDPVNGFVYVFSRDNSTNASAIVSQMNTALTSQSVAVIGLKNTNAYVLDGDFDNAYYTTGPKAGAGTLYACGTDANNAAKPSLYAMSFAGPNGVMNTTPAMSDNRHINPTANPNGTCSSLLDFFDGTTDRLFVGVGADAATTGGNQVTEWNVNTRIPANTTLPNNTATGYWGGTSAFSIDNVSTEPQAASIYFGTLSAPPAGTTTPCGGGNFCAVKLTQSGLQ
jgi:hypothetical protein